MNNPTFICKTDADFLLETFCFKDGVAFFYGKMKNGIIEYFVNDGQKVHGPFDVCPKTDKLYYPDDLEKLSFRDFEWYIQGEEHDKKSEEDWHNTLNELGEIANEIAKITPESEYDESAHVLTYYNSDGTTKEQYFVTNAKKYGPYAHIFPAFYKNENNFQFIFQKKIPKNYRSPKPNYYYNYNGKEFKIGKETPCFFYDPKEHAILQQSDLSYIIIDGKKMDFFNGECSPCSIRTDGTHTLITGKDKSCDIVFHYILDGVEHIIHTDGEIYHCDCESVTYFSNHKIWYHNETQISVPIPGSNSEIFGSAVRYEKQGIPYILLKGNAYNGTQGFLYAKTQGFLYLKDGALYFKEYNYQTLCAPKSSPLYQKSPDEIIKDIDNNFKTLAAEHRLAGE
ncbi:MAG: hypothetical protein IK024_10830 [Treponema sp.]|nr:hypothetical protein [Treponema sp.]